MNTPSTSKHPSRPVTMRDIAARAGVSASAVSLALRNSPEVSQALRMRIQELSREMGYRPNPLLSAYQAQVRSLKPVSHQATIAWINDHPDEAHWDKVFMNPLLKGARDRVKQIGYDLDEIWLPPFDENDSETAAARYEKILRARGIHAAILPMNRSSSLVRQPWENFSVVCIGRHHTLPEHPVTAPEIEHHMVIHDDYGNVRLAVDKLREAGCRKIGLAIQNFVNHESDGLLVAGYLDRMRNLPRSAQVPVLMDEAIDGYPRKVADWLIKYKPDAVLISQPVFLKGVEMAGLRVPEDIRLAHLHLSGDVAGWSGIDRNWHRIGGAAVDLVTAHLTRNERGVPAFGKKMLIGGSWVEGST